MANNPKYYIIESSALPEVFLKVAEAKRLLDTGEVSTVNDATRRAGISRSAFYKYRDSILPFQNLMSGRIITFQLALHDETGILSSLLTIFAQWGANILTINQRLRRRDDFGGNQSPSNFPRGAFALLEFHAGRRPCGYFSRLTGSGNRFISSPSHRLRSWAGGGFLYGKFCRFFDWKTVTEIGRRIRYHEAAVAVSWR